MCVCHTYVFLFFFKSFEASLILIETSLHLPYFSGISLGVVHRLAVLVTKCMVMVTIQSHGPYTIYKVTSRRVVWIHTGPSKSDDPWMHLKHCAARLSPDFRAIYRKQILPMEWLSIASQFDNIMTIPQ